MAWEKLTKSWVRLPKSRLIRGYEGRVSRTNLGREFQAHLSCPGGDGGNEADIIQNDLRAGGEAGKGCVVRKRYEWDDEKIPEEAN